MSSAEIILNSIQNNINQVEVLSHNVANANTPGFKAAQVFSEFNSSGKAKLINTVTNKAGSSVVNTNRSLDIALLNQNFLQVEYNNQLVMTRNGRLHIDSSGQLKHSSGAFVIGELGHIQLPEGDVQINNAGKIYVNGEYLDKLVSVRPSEGTTLNSIGSGLYSPNGKVSPHINDFQQGAINSASVDVSQDMVRLIELSRHTQSLQKALHALDQISNAGINELGKK
ncbi:flagellar basal body rod C-terminal domain-containing protein [Flocculibacter collagenilyticus]|uniref:flagellar basal body rod C-terminal domain-containing protein n=1 Tax=Flocculibacter collagenilyticus TaxID=2744479 RepID=UPI0018F408E0|nr:flagellar basal body rod C-terminal domain-containing protein [Flocculibacter collagenilyticus]